MKGEPGSVVAGPIFHTFMEKSWPTNLRNILINLNSAPPIIKWPADLKNQYFLIGIIM